MGKVPLSRVMAGLQTSYTQYFNRRHRRAGHLFQGRYKAFLVEKDRYARDGAVHPREPGPGRHGEEGEWHVWSSDRYFRRGEGPAWLDLDRVLPILGRTRAAGRGIPAPDARGRNSPTRLPAHGQVVKGGETSQIGSWQRPESRRPSAELRLDRRPVVSRGEGVGFVEMKGPAGTAGGAAQLLTAWLGRGWAASRCRGRPGFRTRPSTFARGVGGWRKRSRRCRSGPGNPARSGNPPPITSLRPLRLDFAPNGSSAGLRSRGARLPSGRLRAPRAQSPTPGKRLCPRSNARTDLGGPPRPSSRNYRGDVPGNQSRFRRICSRWSAGSKRM
jgi:hypothetical protein